jgi:hypothetical protein
MDEPIDFAAVDELLAGSREAVRRAAEAIRKSREVQEWSRALREELRQEMRRASSPLPRPRLH